MTTAQYWKKDLYGDGTNVPGWLRVDGTKTPAPLAGGGSPDPPPVSSNSMLIGASPGSLWGDLDAMLISDGSGGKTANKGMSVRTWYDTGGIRNYNLTLAKNDPADHVASILSFDKVGNATSMAQSIDNVNTGNFDTPWLNFLNSIPAGQEVYIHLLNEIDNKIAVDVNSAAGFRAAITRFHNIYLSSNCDKTKVKFGPSLMGFAYQRAAAGGGPYFRNFYPFDAQGNPLFSLIGHHSYDNWRPPGTPSADKYSTQTPAYYHKVVLDFAVECNVGVVCGEMAAHPDPTRPNYRPQRMQAWIDYMDQHGATVYAWTYFQSWRGSKGPWWLHQNPHTGYDLDENAAGTQDARSQGAIDEASLEWFRTVIASHRSLRV